MIDKNVTVLERKEGSCTYRIVPKYLSFLKDYNVEGISDQNELLIELESLYVYKENEGNGSRILQDLLLENKGKPVVLMAGPLDLETTLEIEINESKRSEFFKRLTYFYEKNGFHKVDNIQLRLYDVMINLNK